MVNVYAPLIHSTHISIANAYTLCISHMQYTYIMVNVYAPLIHSTHISIANAYTVHTYPLQTCMDYTSLISYNLLSFLLRCGTRPYEWDTQ